MYDLNQPESSDPHYLTLAIQSAYHESLHLYARRRCSGYQHDESLAADLVQDLYYTILTKPEQVLKGVRRAGLAYLLKIINYKLIDYNRKLKSINRVQRHFMKRTPESGSLYFLCSDLYIEHLQQQLHDVLPEAEYRTIALYFEGYTYKEISEKLQLPVTTINMQIHRAKKRLPQNGIDLTTAATDY